LPLADIEGDIWRFPSLVEQFPFLQADEFFTLLHHIPPEKRAGVHPKRDAPSIAVIRQQTIRDINNRSQTGSENISFNTGGVLLIGNSQCRPTGELEKAVLELITNAAK